MKILHIALSDGGGAGLGMMNLHRALLAQGVDSKVLVGVKTTDEATVVEAAPNQHVWPGGCLGFFLQRVARRLGVCFTAYDRLLLQIYKMRSEHPVSFSSPITPYDLSVHPLVKEADVVNLHFASGFVDMESFFAKVKKPIVWTMRDENPGLGGFHYRASKEELGSHYAALEDEFLRIKRRALEGCERLHIVSLSPMMMDFCRSVDFLSGRPNVVIPNPISPDDYVLCDRAAARRERGLQDEKILVSFVCHSLGEPRKGFMRTWRGMRSLGDDRIKLLCVGKKTVPVDDPQVILLGTVADKRRLSLVYSASDVFVSPSEQESFGKTVVEALYCGTPVVSTPVGIAPEIIDKRNGVICEEGNSDEIVDGVLRVLDADYDREAIRQQAIERFSPQQVASQYVRLYESVMGEA